MKLKVWGLVGLCAAVTVIGTDIASAAGSGIKDERAIQALQARLAAAVSARDLDAVMNVYVPGDELFVFDSDLPRQHTGWEAYKKDWWAFLGSAVNVKADVNNLGITVEGKAAFSHELLHLAWLEKKDGSRHEQLMSVSDAYRKIDGRWLIVMEHWSIPVVNGKAALLAWP